jgi:hypothetical protein
VLDEVEKRRLRPVEVVQDDHERAVAGERLEQPADGPVRLRGRRARGGDTHRAGDSVRDQVCLVFALDERGEGGGLASGRELAHDVQEREVGDALAVGRTAADDDPRPSLDLVERLADQPRLADTGHAEDGYQPACPLGDAALEGVPKET